MDKTYFIVAFVTVVLGASVPALGSESIIHPKKMAEYFWHSSTSEWRLEDESTLTFDEQGRLIKEVITADGEITTTTLILDEYGKKIENIMLIADEATPDNVVTGLKSVYTYDTKVHGFLLSLFNYRLQDGTWNETSNKVYAEIDRNALGNIVEIRSNFIEYARSSSTSSQPTRKIVIEYGEDNKPDVITEWNYDLNGNWSVTQKFSDCEWIACDGQITGIALDNIAYGANRMSSCKYTFNGVDMTATFSYDESIDGVTMTALKSNGEVGVQRTCAYNTANGIYTSEVIKLSKEPETTIRVSKSCFLGFGGLDIDIRGTGDKYEIRSWFVGKETYDTNNRVVETIERTFKPSGEITDIANLPSVSDDWSPLNPPVAGTWKNSQRFVFSDYSDVSGLTEISSDSSDGPVEYYRLDGIRVSQPTAGFYIRRQGGKSTKVLIRN